ncbi:MAG: phosphoribosylglycinamide formyltransferase [Ignavibacteriae bacterium]|nr:phosphoribosylglycinamide formyltransferase [Ignavibacteriota bacterium]
MNESKSASGGLRIAVLASGRGSNLRAIVDAIHAGIISNAKVSLVLSNNSSSGALEFARQQGIPAVHCSRLQFSSDAEFVAAMMQTLREHNNNFIVLAGYMKKLDPTIISSFKNRIINIHPALLPAYGGKGMYGMHVHEAVIANRDSVSGATVHLVDEEYDRGPVVLQERVDVSTTDTPESLAEKVLKIEHTLYPKAINLFAQGRIHVNGQQVTIEQK